MFVNTLMDQEFWASDGFLHMLTTVPFNASLAVTTYALFLFILVNTSASSPIASPAERAAPREKMLEVVAHARQGVSEEREEMEASAALTTLEAVLGGQRGRGQGA